MRPERRAESVHERVGEVVRERLADSIRSSIYQSNTMRPCRRCGAYE